MATGTAEFTVRSGYVGVVRAFNLKPTTSYSILENGHLTELAVILDFFINGVAVPSMTNLEVVIDPLILYPTFFIAERDARISLRVTYNFADAGLPEDTLNVKAMFFGNFILSSGAPPEFEVGNKGDQPVSPGGVPLYPSPGTRELGGTAYRAPRRIARQRSEQAIRRSQREFERTATQLRKTPKRPSEAEMRARKLEAYQASQRRRPSAPARPRPRRPIFRT